MIWDLLRYGWQHAYLLTIEGIPVAFGERAGIPIPAAFASLALDARGAGTLVIDESAEIGQQIDRGTGIGVGYPLTFRLADNSDLAGYFRKRTYEAKLTADVAATDATIHVLSSSDWGGAGAKNFWLGTEYVQAAGVTIAAGKVTAFTGCTRGGAGGYGQIHLANQPGAICVDVPAYWRGRECRLYAQPVSPGGIVSAVAAERVEVWRGYIDAGPDRSPGFWQFEALSLDRKLATMLPPKITGIVQGGASLFGVNPAWSATFELAGYNGVNALTWQSKISIQPFLGLSGQMSEAQIWGLIVSAFSTALAADPGISGLGAGAYVNGLAILTSAGQYHTAMLDLAADGGTKTVQVTTTVYNGTYKSATEQAFFNNGVIAHGQCHLGWTWNYQESQPFDFGVSISFPPTIAVLLDSAPDFTVAADGFLTIDGAAKIGFGSASLAGNLLTLGGCKWLSGKSLKFEAGWVGQKCEIAAATYSGTPASAMRQCLESSGTPGARGPDDLWSTGYTIDVSALDLPTFTAFDGFAGQLQLRAQSADSSFAALFGPLLALLQHGICARQTAGGVLLSVVPTSPAGSAPVATLQDNHLLTSTGWPCTSQRRRDIANAVIVSQVQAGAVIGVVSAFDASIALGQGGKTLEFAVPCELVQYPALAQLVANAGQSLLRQSQALQVVEIACVPWFFDVTVGDLIAVSSADPTLWQYGTGKPGYTGNARVIGLKRRLLDGALRLVCLLDGEIDTGNLSPAVRVSAFDDAVNPTWIEVADPSSLWLAFFSSCLASLSPARLLHYQPGGGAEGTSQGYTFSAAALVAGACRLTIAAKIGAPVLDVAAHSTLTLPTLANCSAFEAFFSHAGDGTKWA